MSSIDKTQSVTLKTRIVWEKISSPNTYVAKTLAKEADDIPLEKIQAREWHQETIDVREIQVDDEMIADHDSQPLHLTRRDNFVKAIGKGQAIKPLIVLGKEKFLVDGYARYRAIKKLGIISVEILRQL